MEQRWTRNESLSSRSLCLPGKVRQEIRIPGKEVPSAAYRVVESTGFHS